MTIVLVTTNYVKSPYAMTYLELLQSSEREPLQK